MNLVDRQVSGFNLDRMREKVQRFAEAYPAVPNLFAMLGLGLIVWYLAPLQEPTRTPGRGFVVETVAVITDSSFLVEWVAWLRAAYRAWVPAEFRLLGPVLFSPTLYLVVPFLMLLEYLFPARPDQPILGRSHFQDIIWLALRLPTETLIVSSAMTAVRGLYDTHLSFLTISATAQWPGYIQVPAAVFLSEFCFWASHFVRHKVGNFWSFHAVHHSQTRMNFATEDRSHFADLLISNLMMVLPLLMFQVATLKTVGAIVIYRGIHNLFIHCNIKLNLGWLGWIFASPQFHRVHHSIESEQADKNFGGLLSVFDYAFGTAYPSRTVYPATGIADERFPDEGRAPAWQLPANWLRQTIYPFTTLRKR